MSGLSNVLHEHLQRDCTTLCHCWMLRRRDGISFGFTDHDFPLAVAGNFYKPHGGFAQTEARNTLGMAVDSVEVEGVLSSDELKEDDISAGLFDGAEVSTVLVNWQDTSVYSVLRTATIGKITRADGRFIAELESLTAALDTPNGRVLRRECDARLGDGRCRFNLSNDRFSGSGSVSSIQSSGMFAVEGLDAFSANWFALGEIFWTSGRHEGRTSIVSEHRIISSQIMLRLAASEPLPQIDDRFTIIAGCDKRFSTCKTKFANPENFRGFPHLPGNDAAYGYVTDEIVFDGKALVE